MVLIVCLAILGIVSVFTGASFLSKKFNRSKPPEVAGIIERFVEGKSPEREWDDFISLPINDPALDKVRLRCAQLDREFPPVKAGEYTNEEGVKVLKEYIRQLKQAKEIK